MYAEKAKALAKKAHAGQCDKAGKPYFHHVETVAMAMDTDIERAVAYLHDTVEDTPLTLDALRAQGFPEEVVQAVDALTHRAQERYDEYLRRVKANALAVKVKKADLTHNMDTSRLPSLSPKDQKRVEKYKNAMLFLCEK